VKTIAVIAFLNVERLLGALLAERHLSEFVRSFDEALLRSAGVPSSLPPHQDREFQKFDTLFKQKIELLTQNLAKLTCLTMTITPTRSLILVTGAARSGKSEWAEVLAQRSTKTIVYVATAQVDPSDQEWQARIEQHRNRRPPTWKTLHTPTQLAETIRTATSAECLLIDSLGTWLANHLEQADPSWETTVEELLNSLHQANCEMIFVAEETGWGVVPAYLTGRRFRDRLGNLTRQIAAISDYTYLVVAGYALDVAKLGVLVKTSDSQRDSLDF
jgi:adenosylcobinamide kinase/adenosylcobinamide-phosphate guanylyltransferase